MESLRLEWHRDHQGELRSDLYRGLADAVHHTDSTRAVGRRTILPSTFGGGPREMSCLYQDAMAMVRKLGKPDAFVTMTANPNWPEITRELLPGQTAMDRPDLVSRVFQLKLQALLREITCRPSVSSPKQGACL
jgi:hypothetical protein